MLNGYRVVTTHKTPSELGLSLRVRRSWFAEGSDAGAPPVTDSTPAPNGSTVQPVIDWTKVTIPEEAIKQHPAYKAVLSESIERRQELAALKKSKDASVTEQPKEEVDRLTALEQKIEALNRENQIKARSLTVATVAAANKIPAELHNLISGDTQEEIAASAALIAKYIKVEQAAPPPANPAGPAPDSSLLKAVIDRMTQGSNLSPFDPGFQKQLGG